VWVLGLVSLLMDTSSELTHSLLPLFMTTALGAGMVTIGVVEGVAEATAAFAKVFSGALSDRWRRRKPLVVLGYGLAALSKPAFPLATSVAAVFAARFADRIGKGIRGAPRDALIADHGRVDAVHVADIFAQETADAWYARPESELLPEGFIRPETASMVLARLATSRPKPEKVRLPRRIRSAVARMLP